MPAKLENRKQSFQFEVFRTDLQTQVCKELYDCQTEEQAGHSVWDGTLPEAETKKYLARKMST